jgi:murein tripeptide amidase MpaA
MQTATTIDYARYIGYDDLTRVLFGLQQTYPEMLTIQSIGTSHQGRNIWLATITNPVTGGDTEKPGYWIDANIHAEEVVGTMVALYTIDKLLDGYGRDDRITRLLDEQVFYIVPRLNPDAAEQCLTTPYPWCGNGRFAPEEVQTRGLRLGDLNGDGSITMMRVPDPLGEWRVSSVDARIMTQRAPDEHDDDVQYYRLLPEGELPDFDGAEFIVDAPNDGNLNRNFPANFLPEEFQYGAGRFPLSEPESRAVVEFFTAHPNIVGAEAYHTHGGVILRPFLNQPDAEFEGDDLAVYTAIGALGTAETDYPLISVYEEFTDDKAAPRTGSFMEWAFEQLGIITFSTELWDIWRIAEIAEPDYFRFQEFGELEKVRLLQWVDEHVPGGYLDWQPFDHPQLGPVEIGGWVNIWTFRNPPGALIEAECEKNFRFTLRHAACAPSLAMSLVTAEPLGADLYRIRAVVENRGYLPTNVSSQAIKQKIAKPVLATIALDGAELIMGEATQSLGHLAGRSERRTEWSPWGNAWGSPRRRAEWLVRGAQGAIVTVEAHSEKAGVARMSVELEGIE